VVIQGVYTENSVIQVENISMPPIIPRNKTESIFSVDYFAGKPNQGVADLDCKSRHLIFVQTGIT
jgi:hypothetical protein